MDLDNTSPSGSDESEKSAPVRKRASRRVSSATQKDTPAPDQASAEKAPATKSRVAKVSAEKSEAPAAEKPATDKPVDDKAPEGAERPKRRRSGSSDKARNSSTEDTEQTASDSSENSDSNDSGDDSSEGGYSRNRGGNNSRGRGRDRRRGRSGNDEDGDPEVSDDDVLIPIGGILDVLDNYAFVRTQGYLPGSTDVYVSLGQVKKYNLRKGDAVIGAIRQPREGEHQGRQKYNALVSVDSVNGQSVEEAATRPEYAQLVAVYPTEQLRMETTPDNLTNRMVDVFAPVAKGQRGIIVGAPKTGKSELMQNLAMAVAENTPDAHLMMVLIDEQPETISEIQRHAKGEVIASSFDRSADDHTTIAELAVERAKRLVELGHDVVVMVDSLTRLARAYQLSLGGTSRAGSTDTAWVFPTKKLFGAARNVEGGGSLTMLATVVTHTGMDMDDVVASEISGAATMELVLSNKAAKARVYPAIDIAHSGTRKESGILSGEETSAIAGIRKGLSSSGTLESLVTVLDTMRSEGTNAQALNALGKKLGS